ncbi:glycosyltransferase [Shigella flexneri]
MYAKYNTQFSLNYELKKSFVCPINDETVLIHYVGPTNLGITGPVIQVRDLYQSQRGIALEK